MFLESHSAVKRFSRDLISDPRAAISRRNVLGRGRGGFVAEGGLFRVAGGGLGGDPLLAEGGALAGVDDFFAGEGQFGLDLISVGMLQGPSVLELGEEFFEGGDDFGKIFGLGAVDVVGPVEMLAEEVKFQRRIEALPGESQVGHAKVIGQCGELGGGVLEEMYGD